MDNVTIFMSVIIAMAIAFIIIDKITTKPNHKIEHSH
jgi:hypothetical protein